MNKKMLSGIVGFTITLLLAVVLPPAYAASPELEDVD